MSVADRKILEAILLLADDPVPAGQLGEVLERPTAEVELLLQDLAAGYAGDDRGFVLGSTPAGWRLYTDPECAPWLERFVRRNQNARLSGASLEVLSIIAYKGPISRSQVSDIRGVDSDGVVKTLEARGLIAPAGRDEGPGAPTLFSVSDSFMERMGLASIDELPPLSEFMPDPETIEDMEAKLSPNA